MLNLLVGEGLATPADVDIVAMLCLFPICGFHVPIVLLNPADLATAPDTTTSPIHPLVGFIPPSADIIRNVLIDRYGQEKNRRNGSANDRNKRRRKWDEIEWLAHLVKSKLGFAKIELKADFDISQPWSSLTRQSSFPWT
jgi:hypothetical protein